MNDISIAPDKQCAKCKQYFPATFEYFGKRHSGKSDLSSYCKSCASRAHKEWTKRNPRRNNKNKRDWEKRNPDKVKEYYKKTRLRPQKRTVEINYRKRNKQKILDNARRYRQAHKDSIKARNRYYKARKRHAQGKHSPAEVVEQYKRQHGKCYYCNCKLGNAYHVDHVIPLSRGGSNGIDNIVIACPSCNMHKHDKLPHEWPEGGRLA